MPDNLTNPDESDPQVDNVDTGGGNLNVDLSDWSDEEKDFFKGTIEKVTGRQYNSTEDFIKHYQNLNSLVGDQSIKAVKEKAGNFDKVIEQYSKTNKVDLDTAMKELLEFSIEPEKQSLLSQTKAKNNLPDEVASALADIKQFKAELEEQTFSQTHPEIKDSLKLLRSIADTMGKSLKEVYEDERFNLKEIIANAAAFEESKKKSDFLESRSRLSVDSIDKIKKAGEAIKQASENNRQDAEIEFIKIFGEQLSKQING
jgi:hypothetical protein